MEELLRRIIEKKGWSVISIEVRPDHVHVFLNDVEPQISLLSVVKYLKGVTGLSLFKKFPELREKFRKWKIWSKSYYVGTAGEVSKDVIQRYERLEHE